MASSAISLQAPIGVQDNRNKIINGDFNIWQRGLTIDVGATGGGMTGAGAHIGTTPRSNSFVADRWRIYANAFIGITAPDMVISRRLFDLGLPSGADNTSKWYLNIFVGNTGAEATNKVGNWGGFTCATSTNGAGATDGGSWLGLIQDIEDVRIFENKTCILSFWAKSDITNQRVAPVLKQEFAYDGVGGTGSLLITGTTGGLGHTLDNTWRQYKTSFGIPSIEGQPALGTSGDDALQLQFILHANTGKAGTGVTFELGGGLGKTGNISFAQVQLEQGSKGTEFDKRGYAGDVFDCQRYYCKSYALETIAGVGGSSADGRSGGSIGRSHGRVCRNTNKTTTNGGIDHNMTFPTAMRKAPYVWIYNGNNGHQWKMLDQGSASSSISFATSYFDADADDVQHDGIGPTETSWTIDVESTSGDSQVFCWQWEASSELDVTTT